MKKFMNRTSGLKVLYGFIAGAAVLFAACSNPVSPPPNAGISTPPGTGQVRVSIAGEDFAPARTIYPTQPWLHSYVYTFTKDGAGAGEVKTPVSGRDFTLVTGNWNLTVEAYLEAAHTNLAAAGSAAFTVTEGGSTSVSITLEPEKTTGSGTLTYTVEYPSRAALVSLTWEKLGVAGTTDLTSGCTPTTARGVTTLSGTKTPVDAGYYVITAALTEGGKSAGKKEVVHIYQNLTTEAVFTFFAGAGDFTESVLFNVNVNGTIADTLDEMKSLIASLAAAGGGASRNNPIVVSIAIDDVRLLSGTNSGGADPLHKLFDSIPNGVYVAYDLSGCTFTSIPSTYYNVAGYRQNKAHLASITLPDTLTTIGGNAFRDCSGLTSVTIPDSVISIGNSFDGCSGLASVTIGNGVTSLNGFSFSSNTNLTSVIIGDSVTSIGVSAFRDCSGLTSVTIPDSVTSIGNYAFYGCSDLTSVTIPESVASIGEWAFYGCSNLSSIQVNGSNNAYSAIDGVLFNKLGTELIAYPARKSSTTYTIPNIVTSIGAVAFAGCTGLTTVTISDNVESIGAAAFAGCSGLTSVTIGDRVNSIGNDAFWNCSGLTAVTIGDSVTSIGEWAFSYCSGLTLITIGDSVASVGNYAFYGCSGLTSVVINTNYVLTNFKSIFGTSLTSVTIGGSVTSIGNEFYNYSGLTTVTIGDSVTSIGGSAFSGCSGLSSVTIEGNVTSIGNNAFNGCSGLTTVTIGDNVTSIDYSKLFSGCSNLGAIQVSGSNSAYSAIDGVLFNNSRTELIAYPAGKGSTYTIPNGVTSIGNSAFYGCSGLISVTIPNSVTSIGSSAFIGCSGLTSITIGDSITFDRSIFNGCSNLSAIQVNVSNSAYSAIDGVLFNKLGTELIAYPAGKGSTYTIPNGVESIGYDAFRDCSVLTSVTIPDSVISIDFLAFYRCSSLASVTIGNSVTSIDFSAFEDCSGLTSVTIPDSVISIGDYAFSGCSGLASVIIGDNVTSIGAGAFRNCSGLASVTIPESVISIGSNAFNGCSGLTSVTIPDSVTSIDNYAFYGCTGLISVYVLRETPSLTTLGTDVFASTNASLIIYVPAGVVTGYQTAWSDYTGIIQ
ncbi:hypothetical protein AGMMS4952_13080 [Spirochaetia bacterium]|nr:hypothetical protein AGMMS4952_13080 [Spirochaetia bacterium]